MRHELTLSQIPVTVRITWEACLKIEIPEIMIQWAWDKTWKATFLFSSARDSDMCSLDQHLGNAELNNHKEQNEQNI